MKKSISVSNLTLDLWLEYVRPAARAAGIFEEVPARDDWHKYIAEVTEEAAADEVAHCMYCACMNSHIANNDYSTEGEAQQMLYQLEISMEYHNTKEVNALYNALSAMLNTETTEENKEEETMNTNIIETIKKEIEARTERSAWSKGVTVYALELVEGLEEAINEGYFDPSDIAAPKVLEKALLNGASSWNEYSWGGCSLIYDRDIAERLCCPSELKKTRNGERRPNSREEWLDVQARALYQACRRVKSAARAALA